MNEHIELVKKSLADSDSVTEEELKANKKAAYCAFWAATAAFWAATAAKTDDFDDAEYCKQKAIKAIAEYEELTK